jgi:hypothetical protein
MKIEVQDEKLKRIGDVAIDYYQLATMALEKYLTLKKEIEEAEKKGLFDKYRKINEELRANVKYREQLSENLFNNIKTIIEEKK